jgi:hypothetical protein
LVNNKRVLQVKLKRLNGASLVVQVKPVKRLKQRLNACWDKPVLDRQAFCLRDNKRHRRHKVRYLNYSKQLKEPLLRLR